MGYTEFDFTLNPDTSENREILVSYLDDIGFESYWEEDDVIHAYLPTNKYNPEKFKVLSEEIKPLFSIDYKTDQLEDKNWNELWESNFNPVYINDQCIVRAPFHDPVPDIPYELIIQPQMSFGTAHHETTAMVLDLMTSMDIKNKDVLDMGSGTGVLAILAKIKGANKVVAVDNDEWAVGNTQENIRKNNQEIDVLQGDVDILTNYTFDLILANINRNILLNHIPSYSKILSPNATIIFSGFYTEDLDSIRTMAEKFGLNLINYTSKNNWVAAVFTAIES
ncbi:MAG: 50S ribosomal protein L11 methyltransferase [Bacteroidales bacterium]|nr:50S ribosomal protein L11 methyltransferase [Bacteroidales bacterium]MCF8327117.1 50S ribosomal protein L11 methyltransferase [Bacteroidales bacterium]